MVMKSKSEKLKALLKLSHQLADPLQPLAILGEVEELAVATLRDVDVEDTLDMDGVFNGRRCRCGWRAGHGGGGR